VGGGHSDAGADAEICENWLRFYLYNIQIKSELIFRVFFSRFFRIYSVYTKNRWRPGLRTNNWTGYREKDNVVQHTLPLSLQNFSIGMLWCN